MLQSKASSQELMRARFLYVIVNYNPSQSDHVCIRCPRDQQRPIIVENVIGPDWFQPIIFKDYVNSSDVTSEAVALTEVLNTLIKYLISITPNK